MKISLTSISIGDRVQAAKIAPNNTDTSSIPTSINPQPGDSTIQPVETTQLDRAGGDINKGTQDANRATDQTNLQNNNPASKGIQYDAQTVNAADQAKPPNREQDISGTPQPKSKGFKESLIGAQMSQKMNNLSTNNHAAPDRDYGHNNGDPNQYIEGQPDAEPIRRDKMQPYDNSNNRVQEPKPYPISEFDKSPNAPDYIAPNRDTGPSYKPKNLSIPKIGVNPPRINTPRFK
jgi:hypothetical protein